MQKLDKKSIIDIDKQNALIKIQVNPFKIEGDIRMINATSGFLYILMDFDCLGNTYVYEYQIWCDPNDHFMHNEKDNKCVLLESGRKRKIEKCDFNLSKSFDTYTLFANNDDFDLKIDLNIIEKTIECDFFRHLAMPGEYTVKEIYYSKAPIIFREPIFDPIDLLKPSE